MMLHGLVAFVVLVVATWALIGAARHGRDVFRGNAEPPTEGVVQPSVHLLGLGPAQPTAKAAAATTKLFYRRARDAPKCRGEECLLVPNSLECEDRYCYACPLQIACTPQNAQISEADVRQVWKCEGRIQAGNDGVELAGHEVRCMGGASEGFARYGCSLSMHMTGPWTGYSPLIEFVYDVIVFIVCALFVLLWLAGGGRTGVLIGAGGGGSRVSSSWG